MNSGIARLFLAFIAVAAFWAGPANALSVDQVRFGVHDGKTRMVLDISAPSDFRVFALADPYRLIIDLPEFEWRAGAVEKPVETGISAVRQGNLEYGISRIVFDMQQPVSLQNAFTLPSQGGKPDRLVVDYVGVTPAAFQLSKNTTLGKLTSGAAKPLVAPSSPQQNYQTASATTGVVQPEKKPVQKQKSQIYKPLIVLDPGHGGADPGAIGANKVHEKDVVLKLSKELKKQLEATGRYRVILTRTNDKYIRLRDRVAFARKHEADLFVSIHADSIEKPHVRGASVYTLSETASDKQTASLAARENRADIIAGVDLSVEDQEVANILVDLAMRDTMNHSKYFANTLIDKFHHNQLRTLETAHRYAGFAVLKAPDIPSVLIEAGFLSNRSEAQALNTSKYRSSVAKSIADGIDAYFVKIAQNEKT